MEKYIVGENGINYTLGEDGIYYPVWSYQREYVMRLEDMAEGGVNT